MTPDEFKELAAELRQYFKGRKLPKKPVKTCPAETINDHKKFVESHLNIVSKEKITKADVPYMRRLVRYRTYLESLKPSNGTKKKKASRASK